MHGMVSAYPQKRCLLTTSISVILKGKRKKVSLFFLFKLVSYKFFMLDILYMSISISYDINYPLLCFISKFESFLKLSLLSIYLLYKILWYLYSFLLLFYISIWYIENFEFKLDITYFSLSNLNLFVEVLKKFLLKIW